MAEDLIKVRENAEIHGNSQEFAKDLYHSISTESIGSAVDSSTDQSKRHNLSHDKSTNINSYDILKENTQPTSKKNTNQSNDVISFDDPSWLEGLQEEMEIITPSNKNSETNAPVQQNKCDLRYCYVTDRGKESNDQNDAEVDIDNGVSYLVSCYLGKRLIEAKVTLRIIF